MSAEPAEVIELADHRAKVEETDDAVPVEATPEAVQLGRERAEVEKISSTPRGRTLTQRARDAAYLTGLGVGVTAHTVWHYQTAGEISQQIRDAKAEMRSTGDRGARKELAEEIEKLRARRRQVAHARHREPITIAGLVAAGVYPASVAIGTLVTGPVALAALLPVPVAAAIAGRRARKQRNRVPGNVVDGTVELTAAEAGAEPDDAPALDGGALAEAVRACGFSGHVKVLEAPAWGDDGTCTTLFELPPGVTVSMLKKKEEQLAGALGRDVFMVDISKTGSANRGALWMSDRDPFEEPRPSPLLHSRGGVDAWADGVPVAWAKRGDHVRLPIKNASFLIGGMTRSGKGVGAANLIAGAALDTRVNLRIVAGKENGEWDAYARTGVAATYFKPDPARLLALIRALHVDMDRRNRVLGELGKSKVTPGDIDRVGGLEVLVIDELATYTRPKSSDERDDILEGLIKLSSVAAGAGTLLVLITQYPEVDVIPQGLAMNCGTRWAMRVDSAIQSNAILGGSASGGGRDSSKFDPPRPGLGWLVNPFAGVTDLARSFDLDEDERGEITKLCERAAELRQAAGRLAGQWDDPIEAHLLTATGLSSASGGPRRDGQAGRAVAALTAEQRQQYDAARGALAAMDRFGRDAAQLDEMAEEIGSGMTGVRLGELLRGAGAGGTVKVTIDGRRVNGYQRADIADAVALFQGD